jgi:electron transport complex protein RnfD
MQRLKLTVAPHIDSGARTDKIMFIVVAALMPAVCVSIYFFGLRALLVYVLAICSALFFEAAANRVMKRANSLPDGSAALTGLLLAMNLPPSAPWWMTVCGSFVAIIVAKMVFGGLGANIFNPALVGRIFLLISFPVQMTSWTLPDGLSGASPLGAAKTYLQNHENLQDFVMPDLMPLLTGNMAGSLGETSAIALLVGGLILLATRTITWHIPVSFIGTVFLLTFGHSIAHPDYILPPLTQILSGGLLLGAFFMATDYVTGPLFPKGKLIFGVGCGVLTVVIRIFGGYPEGVAFAILIMNATVPLLDMYLRPKTYGEGIKHA